MNKKFYEEFIINRNDTLKEIMINKEAWYNYIKFWSNNLGYHSSDNLINIYSYNKDGTMYATYDEWNSIDIGRRIKRGSKGIPVYREGFKTYVFDISQTYGKQFKIWRYNGLLKNELYELYNRKYQINFNPLNYTDEEKFEMIILSNIENSIRENYDTLKEFETNFIIMSVFSIVCSKLGINASLYSDNSFIYIAKLNEESILKSLQIINREACNHYRNFFNNYKNIIKVNNMLENLAQDNIINTDLQASLEALEMTSEVDYETLKKIYELKREKYLEINDINNINTYRISDIDIKDDGYYINDEKITDEEFEKSFRDAEEENFDNTYGLNAGKDIIEIEYNKYNIRDLESAYNYLNSIHDNDLILEELQLEIEDLLESDEQHYLEATNLLNRTIERLDELEKIRSSEEYNHEEEIIDVPKPEKEIKPKKDNNNLEQLSLFEKRENLLANKICDIFNHFDTIYKDTFKIYSVELQAWEHIPSKKRNLSIILESNLIEEYASENSFTYFNKDKTEEEKINNEIANNYFLQKLYKDKDFSINFTPNMIHIYYNNFDYKDIDLSIDSYKKIIEAKQTEELNKKADSSFVEHTLTSTGNNVVLSDSVIKYYNSDRDEITAVDEEKQEELIPRKNYHITDNNIRESFGQKARYKDNVDAINLLKKIENENRFASSEEQEILAKYVGWGGIADAFSRTKEEWNSENQELKSLLTDEEYKEANSSVLTAFYTPNVAIDGIYKALERFGFENGNILEPSCGIGNFFGRLPEKYKDSKLYGVEKDSISGRIAKLLYPNAKIEINGYEDTKFSDNFFDVAIGNVPFGDIPIFDKKYKNNFFIHDYFFEKTLDKVRSGGIIAFITSDGTLDKKDIKVRKYIAERAEFLGAIRLPNTTFKNNANTTITSDIVFLKKRDEIKKDIDEEEWIYTSEYEDGIIINNYFVNNPEMMLGKIDKKTTQFGKLENTLNETDEDITNLLNNAINKLESNVYEKAVYEMTKQNSKYPTLVAEDNIKNDAFKIVDVNNEEVIYKRQDSVLVPYTIQEGIIAQRIKGLCGIRDALKEIFGIQLNDGTDEELGKAQMRLNYLYDEFISKYGYVNEKANIKAFESDPDCYLIASIEDEEEKENKEDATTYKKGSVFNKRTVRKLEEEKNAETAEEALAYSLNRKGNIDFDYMCSIYNKSKEEIIDELDNLIFQNPKELGSSNNGWEIASEYLSGNVKDKLKVAEVENIDGKYDRNITALKEIIPKDLTYEEIKFKLGSTWIPEDVYHQFICELLEISYWDKQNLKLKYVEEANMWLFQASGLYNYGIKSNNTWGTQRADALTIIKNCLNLQSITIFDTLDDDRRIVNIIETANAREKQEMIRQEFKEWLWKDEDRKERLVKLYNEKYNCIVNREFDGSHLSFDGMSPSIELTQDQKNAVARILYGKNTLLYHAVGAGKTFECIAGTMKLKNLNLINKPIFVVPNNLLGQWASEFLKLYPMANILVATEKDFKPTNRKKFFAKIVTGEYDAIIMAHSSFGLIPMSREYEIEYIENQISEITDAIDRILLETSDKKLSVKKIEKMKKNLEVKLKKLIEDTKRDNVVNFEELGIDFLIVDEAHLFKNLPMFSKMHNVAGINNSESKKATDLLMKCNYLEKRSNNGKAIVFATGTAISNSMCEMYAMQKFLQMVHLKELGLEHFDSWASTFGEVVESFEITPDGSGFRTKSRFASFQNIPELMTIFGEVADIKTAKDLNLNIPKLKGGERKIIVAPQSKELKVLIEKFAERSEIIHQGIDSRIDNMLKVTNDGRKAALELRVYDPNLPDLADSKINLAVDNIYNIWFDNIDKRSTQLVFCDLSTPKDDGSFNVYDDIKQKLIKRGVPENEIEFIHNAKTSIQRQNLFDDVNNGIVRILIGSTNKMGAGMNVQKKLIALHHLDCPWRPSDLEQREGRILRQGNENEEVEIFTYVTEGSFDAYSYQLIQTKAEFINQILTHSYNGREAEDIDRDTLTYAEVKAIASGNKLVLDKFKVDNELQKLYVSKARYDKNIHELTKKCNQELPRKIKNLNELLNNYIKDNKRVIDLSGENFNMKIRDNILTSRKDASTSLYKSLSLLKVSTESKIGEISGFDIIGMIEPLNFTPLVFLKGNGKYKVEIYKNDEIGNIIRLENFLKSFDKKISDTNYQIEFNEKQLNDAKEELAKPFANGDRIKELQKEKARIDSELDLDKQGQDVFVSEEDDEKINKKDKDNSLER